MRIAAKALALVLLAALPLFAQDATLSKTEQLKVQVHQLEIQLEQALAQASSCQATLGSVRARVRSQELSAAQLVLRAELEKSHPGYTVDFDKGTLVAKP